jgi:hypothetical protein
VPKSTVLNKTFASSVTLIKTLSSPPSCGPVVELGEARHPVFSIAADSEREAPADL